MIKNRSFIFVFISTFLIFFNLSAKKKDKYEKWINEEVNLIITDAKKAEFKKLKKEKDKDFYIKLFWAKRDPSPQTEKNEFKEEYYRRLSYVNKAFIYGYNRGTGTDMGKVYLYFGKPGRVYRQSPRVVIWVYPAQPWMNLPEAKETISFVFTAIRTDWTVKEEDREKALTSSIDRDGYVIDRSQTDFRVTEAFFSSPKRFLLYPDLEELPEYKMAIKFSPESFEGKLIQQVESTQEDIVQIPFEKKVLFTKAENLSSYLSFLIKIDLPEKISKKVIFFGRLKSETYSSDFRKEKALIKEKDHFLSQIGNPILPGEYELFIGVYDKDKKIFSLKMEKLSVPNFWTKELTLSSLIASPQIQEERAPRKKREFDIFSVGRYSLQPHFSQEYTKDEFLNVFYYIYNLAVDSNQNCSYLIEFELQKGEKNFKLNPQKRQQKAGEEAALLEGTQIPLSALPESGEYELTVKVTDEATKKTVSKKLKFLLL